MKYFFLILLFLFSFSCKTLNYSFFEEITGEEKNVFMIKTAKNSFMKDNGQIGGIYTEKNRNYRFLVTYNIPDGVYKLEFFDIINDNEKIFDARLEENEAFYDFYIDSFFSAKIGSILKRFRYILDINVKESKMFITRDDYKVLKDEKNNFFKFDDYLIIKKENDFNKVKYFYNSKKEIERIEFESPGNNFIITIKD